MSWGKEDCEKELVCRPCGRFLDTSDLYKGRCPSCDSEEGLFINAEDED